MAANTGHDQIAAAARRGRLADTFATALTLIREEKRSPTQCAQLERALQLFKENRLGATVAGSLEYTSENILSLLSHKIENVLHRHALKYFRKFDIEYVGELFTKKRWLSWQTSSLKAAQLCRDALDNLGIPIDIDLAAIGWEPPYRSDPAVIAMFSRRWHDVLAESKSDRLCTSTDRGGCRCVGEMIRDYDAQFFPEQLAARMRGLGLRMGMYVSTSWNIPKHDLQGCEQFNRTTLKSLEREHLLACAIPEGKFSVRAFNFLKAYGIVTHGDLCSKTEQELLGTSNGGCGLHSLNQLKGYLASVGLALKA